MAFDIYSTLGISKTPELVFGLVGPIGVDMELIQSKLENALITVGYHPTSIRVTDLMQQIEVDVSIPDGQNPLEHYESRIDYANKVREKCQDDAALAALSILAVKEIRDKFHESTESSPVTDHLTADKMDWPIDARAYIIRQFKRKEEIGLLRAVYGKKFIQISVHSGLQEREDNLASRIAKSNPDLTVEDVTEVAKKLIKRDYDEISATHGQRVGEAFHLGDVFVNAKSESTAKETVERFIQAFFGKNSVSPTKDEYGAYIAASAAFRSIDTSRQIGAAIFTENGEVLALGSNEVPKAGGGTYWCDNTEPHRDFDDRRDANSLRKNRITYDLLRRLNQAGYLKTEEGSDGELTIEKYREITNDRLISKALLNDITEYGRMAHAEMNAITDAARLGLATKNTILFSTTFPCHNCAKHIVAAGIKRVVFIEPYPKSQAMRLNGDSISLEVTSETKVIFEHFVGISPRRYRDIFEKGKRRNKEGDFEEWYETNPAPRITDRGPGYVLNESSAIFSVLEKVHSEVSSENKDQPRK